MTTTEHSSVITRILRWLEAGYPEGIPRQDRFPLIALLRRRLTDEQTQEIITELTDPRSSLLVEPISADQIETLIERALLEPASAEDVARVSARLAAAGWPLASDLGED